jgi:chloramphenicol-sensitive protein RarD
MSYPKTRRVARYARAPALAMTAPRATDPTADDAAAARFRAGVGSSVAAFTFWGLFPIYVHAVRAVSPLEVLVHRTVWAFVFALAILAAQARWDAIWRAWRSPAVVRSFSASAALLSVNWFVFVWAVSTGHTVGASLGYFINPLVSIALGAIVLRERLSRVQWVAVGSACVGVLWLTFRFGHVPWIGLILAGSFGGYGLMRKTSGLGALEGLVLETSVLVPVGAAYMAWLIARGACHFVNDGAGTRLLLVAAGPITAVPLMLFAAGARRIPLSVLGLLQYITPTLQLALGVLLWHEPFGPRQLVGYAFIWAGFIVASVQSLRNARRSSAPG